MTNATTLPQTRALLCGHKFRFLSPDKHLAETIINWEISRAIVVYFIFLALHSLRVCTMHILPFFVRNRSMLIENRPSILLVTFQFGFRSGFSSDKENTKSYREIWNANVSHWRMLLFRVICWPLPIVRARAPQLCNSMPHATSYYKSNLLRFLIGLWLYICSWNIPVILDVVYFLSSLGWNRELMTRKHDFVPAHSEYRAPPLDTPFAFVIMGRQSSFMRSDLFAKAGQSCVCS